MNKFHFVENVTNNMYWAVSCNLNKISEQDLKYVIKNEKIYNEQICNYFPYKFYSTNNSNPTFQTLLEEMCFDKKILGVAIEKRCDSMNALAPKMYSCFNENKTVKTACKGYGGVANLTHSDYKQVYDEKTTHRGINTNFQLHNGIMSHVKTTKNILTATYTKYKVGKDFSTCIPLFFNFFDDCN
jgi:hypothetical protein